MREIRLPESELKVMQFIWDSEAPSAKAVSEYMTATFGWKKNTTYTVLQNLIGKGILSRTEPNFICTPKIARDQVADLETRTLLERFYGGSTSLLFSHFFKKNKLTQKDLDEIQKMIDDASKKQEEGE